MICPRIIAATDREPRFFARYFFRLRVTPSRLIPHGFQEMKPSCDVRVFGDHHHQLGSDEVSALRQERWSATA
jgi:hypothetical protein